MCWLLFDLMILFGVMGFVLVVFLFIVLVVCLVIGFVFLVFNWFFVLVFVFNWDLVVLLLFKCFLCDFMIGFGLMICDGVDVVSRLLRLLVLLLVGMSSVELVFR